MKGQWVDSETRVSRALITLQITDSNSFISTNNNDEVLNTKFAYYTSFLILKSRISCV